MNVFEYVVDEDEDEIFESDAIEPGLYNHPSGVKKYLVSDDTEVVIVLQDGAAPRASNRWTKTKMETAEPGYFEFDESDGLVLAN